MIIIGGSSNVVLAQNIANILSLPFVKANTQKFEDQELHVQINEQLYEKDVVIIQSTSKPANDHLMELLLLVNTAKRAGAKRIIAVMPYFGYSRQDRSMNAYEPISASLVADLLEASGVDRVITLDLHSKQIEGFFKIGVNNIDGIQIFGPSFRDIKNKIIISPDIGGLIRAQKYSEYLGCDLAVINKIRTAPGQCTMKEIIGEVQGKHCIIVDDIVDSANTICKAADLLIKNGALSVEGCITHAVLSKDAVKKIEESVIQKLYITDSIAHNELPNKIHIIPIVDILVFALKHNA